MDISIEGGVLLEGVVDLPSSKSQTLRALYSAMLATGVSVIEDTLESEDTDAMLGCLYLFGVKIYKKGKTLFIHSPGFKKLIPPPILYVKDSGITLRFLAAFVAIFKTKVTFIGSRSLMRQRSIKELEHGLKQLGVFTKSNDGFCPFTVCGPIKRNNVIIAGGDSQPISALLWLFSLIKKPYSLAVVNPHEKPWINLTLSWISDQKSIVYHKNFCNFFVKGRSYIQPFIYKIPKDFSALAFILAAGCIAGKNIIINGLNFGDAQGDKAIVFFLKRCGAKIHISSSSINVQSVDYLNLDEVDVKDFIDALPILAALSVMSKNMVRIYGAFGARGKESDRITSMAKNLQSLGVKIEENKDGLIIKAAKIDGGICDSFHDHRVAMSCAILGLLSSRPLIIKNAESVKKTYPDFFMHLKELGAKVVYL